jgi:transcriptional regulator with XRE-family HTH domain
MSREIEGVHKAIGIRIRLIRESLGVTQQDLAKKLKYTRTSLVNIEAGRQRLQVHTVEDFARALGTTPKHLLKGIWW